MMSFCRHVVGMKKEKITCGRILASSLFEERTYSLKTIVRKADRKIHRRRINNGNQYLARK
jgi:hypothetical protein